MIHVLTDAFVLALLVIARNLGRNTGPWPIHDNHNSHKTQYHESYKFRNYCT